MRTEWKEISVHVEGKNLTILELVTHNEEGMNIIGILTFCLSFSYAMKRIGRQGRIIHKFFMAVNLAVQEMIEFVIK